MSKNVIPLRHLVGCSPQWAVRDIHFLPNKSGYILQPRRFGHPVKIFEPVPYSGTKSYQNLLVDVYGGTGFYDGLRYTPNVSTIAQNGAMRFTYPGIYYGSDPHNQTYNGYFWTNYGEGNSSARYLDLSSTVLLPYNIRSKGEGYAIRCLVC